MAMEDNGPIPFTYLPPEGPLQVLHADKDILVVVKPCGLLSVTGRGEGREDALATRAPQLFKGARIVHRLDLDTSGVMVMARTAEAHRHLGLQFERRHTDKTYIARVWGTVDADEGEVDLPLVVDWPNRPKQMICHETGRRALTHWEVIAREEKTTLMRLKPVTGRSHQLRVHMLSLGHPIIGDPLYAEGEALAASQRLQLHAHDLTFHHPSGGERLTFVAECPF